MRRNGFQWPLDPQQVGSWVFFAAFIVATGAIVVPILPGKGAWAFAIVYGALALLTLVLTARTTASDGLDRCVLGEKPSVQMQAVEPACKDVPHARPSRPSSRPFVLWLDATVRPWGGSSLDSTPAAEDLSYCYLCQVGVKRNSKHCRICRKCVDNFDHHCVWLNNCIGSRNYAPFVQTIAAVCAMLTAQLVGCAYALARTVSDDPLHGWPAVGVRVASRVEQPLNRTPMIVVLSVLLVLTAPAWLLIGQLCAFHWQLRREGLTTYAFIVREQKRANEPARPSCCARMAARLCHRPESVAAIGSAAPADASRQNAAGSEHASTTHVSESLERRGGAD